ncbi:MAG: hypothetical protein QOE26_1726 [Verrucomicrobiota bacterium]
MASGGAAGCVFFFETAQQLLFAQQFGLQPSGLTAFERMQEAAGSCSGRTSMATTTANRIAVFRITDIYHHGLGASTVISDVEIGDYSDTQQIIVR